MKKKAMSVLMRNVCVLMRSISGLILLSTFALNSCGSSDSLKSSDVDESKIWRSYGVKYDETALTTSIWAQFRVGGSTGTVLSLAKPSSISVLDSNMKLSGSEPKESSISGTTYIWSLSGTPASATYKFTWTKPSGAIVEDTLAMPLNPAQPVFNNSTFNLTNGFTIALDRDAQSAGGKVGATIKGRDKVSQEAIETYKSITSGYNITFSADEVAAFATGQADLVISTEAEKSATDAEGGSLGGKTLATYMRTPTAMTLTR